MTSLDFGGKLEAEVRKIEEDERLNGEDRELLLDFERDLKLEGYEESWIYKLLVHMRKMAEHLCVEMGTTLGGATEDDLKDLVEWVQDRDLAESTVRDYKRVLKRFYKWNEGGEHPEKVKWVNTTSEGGSGKLPKQMLIENDIERLIDAAINPRDEAFTAMLWETGGRIGEILFLKIRDLEEWEHGRKVVVEGKTGERKLPLISCLPYLNNWIENHPRSDDPNAPLWVRVNGDKRGEQLSYRYVNKMLKKTAERAGIDKPVNPHHFRHSRATFLASRMTESQLCQYFGWVQGSDRPQTYVHLSGRDLDSTYSRIHGIEEEKEREESELAPVDCPRCGEMNEPRSKFCQRCGLALGLEEVREMEKKHRVVENLSTDDVEVHGSLADLVRKMVEKELRRRLGDER